MSGLKESGDRRGASVIYCHSPKGESKAKRQDWHTDLDGQKCPGHKHISMIVALDDGVPLPSRGARDVSKPIPVNATKATDFVPVPKGAVVFSEAATCTRACAARGGRCFEYTHAARTSSTRRTSSRTRTRCTLSQKDSELEHGKRK